MKPEVRTLNAEVKTARFQFFVFSSAFSVLTSAFLEEFCCQSFLTVLQPASGI